MATIQDGKCITFSDRRFCHLQPDVE